ncbi:MAG: UDP-glucose 4-epimerase GalE, partial [Deltaproteobacteria bacterium]|nr:UDP-glucose 4-epimerase GalE [Deltaproteobacteria bacterium]
DYGDLTSVSSDLLSRFDVFFLFAGKINVEESMKNPWLYWNENVFKLINFLEILPQKAFIVYSSSAAVYEPQNFPLTEECGKKPVNVYGVTKLAAEEVLLQYCELKELRVVCLRYFNAAGADLEGTHGEDHHPETHFIPSLCLYTLGILKDFSIYGDNWPTKDGTCVRDFIHVLDLADAHVKAVDYLVGTDNNFSCFNVGSGCGYSLLEILKCFQKILNRELNISISNPRDGDMPYLVADISKIKSVMGWQPRFGIDTILETAFSWHKKFPNGYRC